MGGPTTDYNALKSAEATLPAEWYYDGDQYARELKALWKPNWQYVCHASELGEPFSFRTLRVAGQNIVVVRTENGTLSAFHNVCRHRGSVLCPGEAGRLASKLIVCPYHAWAYAAEDGRLVRTSSFQEPKGFDRSEHALFPAGVHTWRGLVFVNGDPSANWDDVAVFQRPPETFANFPLEDMVVGHTWTTTLACNWKTFWENFNECLHCPGVHPELTELVPLFSRGIVNPRDVPDWAEHEGVDDPRYRGGLRAGAETWSSDASAQGHVIASLTPEDLARGHTYASSWPSMFFGGYPDHVRTVRMRPTGPEVTELAVEWFFTPETAAGEDYDMANVINFAKLVIEQDAAACVLNQQGLHAAPFEAGVLMPEEYLLKRFHDWVRAGLADHR